MKNLIDRVFPDDNTVVLIDEPVDYIDLQKSKARPVGSISPNGKLKKIAPGKWVPVKQQGSAGVHKVEEGPVSYVPPEKFNAAAWASKRNDPNATSEYILQQIKDKKVINKIKKTEEKLHTIKQTVELYKVEGSGAAAVYKAERAKRHKEIISTILSPEKREAAKPENGKKPVVVMLGGRGGCLSARHEFLTPNGWKFISEYDEHDKVLAFNTETNTTEFVYPQRYINEACESFYHIKSRGIEQEISDEHTVLFTKKYNPEKWQTIKAKELVQKHTQLHDGWDGLIPCTFSAPQNVDGIALSDDELRLMVAICADGTFESKTTTRCRFSVRKERKKERIVTLLDKLHIEYTQYVNASRPTEIRYTFNAPERNKSLAKYWQATPEQLKIIADEVLHWDGWIDKYGIWQFSTTKKDDADFINYVFSTQNRRSSFYIDERTGTGWSRIWRVSANKSNHAGIRNGAPKIQIEKIKSVDGRKYCFTVPTGFFITRLNDAICITGNSGKSWLNGKVYDPKKAIVLDADEIKGMLKEYQGWNAFEVHEESSDILEKIMAIGVEQGLNLVIDATLKSTDKAIKKVKAFKARGYSVECHYMHLPRQKASLRAISRFMGKSGRYVPIDAVLANTTNEQTFEAIKPYTDAWSFRDNSSDPPPKLVSEWGKGRFAALKKALVLGLEFMKSVATGKTKYRANYDMYDFGDVIAPEDYAPDVKEFLEEHKLEKAKGYKLAGVRKFQGLTISVEHNKGGIRTGVDKDGHEWRTKMYYAYGGIRNTKGADGEYVDCYIGDNAESTKVFIVHQNDPVTGKYDEDKVMLGFNSAEEAKKAYLKQYDRPGFFGSMTIVSMDEFKQMLKDKKGISLKKSKEVKGMKLYKAKVLLPTELMKGAAGVRGVPDGSGPDGNGPTGRGKGGCADAMDKQGLSKNKTAKDFDDDALKQGIAVEMEHTDDPKVAQEIAEDHLTEDPEYYTKLAKMEKSVSTETTHKTPPKGYPKDKAQYAIPAEYKYPLDTEKHIRAAISYFSKPKNANIYSVEQQRVIWGKIKAAAKKIGIELSDTAGPPSVEKSQTMLVFTKARKMPVGTVSHGRKKVAEGKWVPVKSSGKTPKVLTDAQLTATVEKLKKQYGEKGFTVSANHTKEMVIHSEDRDKYNLVSKKTTPMLRMVMKQGDGNNWNKSVTLAAYMVFGKDKNVEISKSDWKKYNIGTGDTMQKSRGYSAGTIRTWNGKKYKKTAEGKWISVSDKSALPKAGSGYTKVYMQKILDVAKKADSVKEFQEQLRKIPAKSAELKAIREKYDPDGNATSTEIAERIMADAKKSKKTTRTDSKNDKPKIKAGSSYPKIFTDRVSGLAERAVSVDDFKAKMKHLKGKSADYAALKEKFKINDSITARDDILRLVFNKVHAVKKSESETSTLPLPQQLNW